MVYADLDFFMVTVVYRYGLFKGKDPRLFRFVSYIVVSDISQDLSQKSNIRVVFNLFLMIHSFR